LLSLWIADQFWRIFSILGVMLLFGIVKKNSIFAGRSHHQFAGAGHRATKQSIRQTRAATSILMTRWRLWRGMFPVLFGQGPSGRKSPRRIAVVIIGGQTMCLLLTLLVTPVAYSLFDDLEMRLVRCQRYSVVLLNAYVCDNQLSRPSSQHWGRSCW